jgi:predicted metalloprotease with PDZ domain
MPQHLAVFSSRIAIIFLLAATAPALGSPATEPIRYTLTFRAPEQHVAEVKMIVPTGKRDTVELMMAAWSPGFYRIDNYASRVQELTAQSPDGKPLAVEQPQKNRRRVATAGAPAVTVSYRLKCQERSVTTNWVGADYAVLNGPATFLTLVETDRRPHEVRLELPAGWQQTVTGLDAAAGGGTHHYRAPDFDTLVDCPIVAGNPVLSEFSVNGCKHIVAAFGDVAQWDGQRAARDLEKIVRENLRLWGFLPFQRYVFLCASRPGGGGLEHLNSTLVTTNPASMRTPQGYRSWLAFVSHEYFHAYNVKRLRPVELGPFDYENQVRTSGLWVAEGLTTYYGDLVVARAGLLSTQEFLTRLSSQIRQLQRSPGRLVQTLDQASLDVWTTSFSGVGGSARTVSYYVKGPVVGFLLDARIRHATQGARSLDDLMKLAYQRYSGARGFTAEQFAQTASEVAGGDLKEWLRKALRTTEELDFGEALDWLGLRFMPAEGGQAEPTWKLEVRPDATEAQKNHLNNWLRAEAPRESAAPVTAVPEEVVKRFKLDTSFYKKHLDYKGFSILSSANVSDVALREAGYLIDQLLGKREDILKAMIKAGCRFMVMAPTEMTTDVPEQRSWDKAYWDKRARGMGGKLSSCGEENLLNLRGDRYNKENILIHEFNHAIHQQGLRTVDPTFDPRLRAAFKKAMDLGLWKGTYLTTNPDEYWAEGVQAYFDCMRPQYGANTREKLQKYDSALFELVDEVYQQSQFRYVRYDQRPLAGPPDKAPQAPSEARPALAHDRSPPLTALAPPLKDSAAKPDRSAAVEQTTPGSAKAAELVASFDGLGVGFEGPQGTAVLRNPSDNSLAVGPDHIVQIVNTRMAVFTKKGKRFDTTGRVLYGPVSTGNVFKDFGKFGDLSGGDAVVRYDQLADRWLIVIPIFRRLPFPKNEPPGRAGGPVQRSLAGVEGQPGAAYPLYQPKPGESGGGRRGGPRLQSGQGSFAICYAVSTSPDPLGAYYRYLFERPLFPDYPRPAVWPDGYYVATSTGDDVIQKHAYVVERLKMLRGEPATEQGVVIDGVNFLNNADLDGKQLPPAGAPNLLLAAGGAQLKGVVEDDGIYVWQFHVDWADSSRTKLEGPRKIAVAPYHYLGDGQLTRCIPQPGTTQQLDVQGDKLMARVVYRRLGDREIIVAAHSVKTMAGGGGIRWYEFRMDKERRVQLHQQGTYAPDPFYRWMPSPALDGRGNLGIGYSFGGTPHFPGQRFAGRLADDPPGVLTLGETVLAEGEAAQTSTNRWQDYTQTAVDPTDDCTIWYVGDYLKKGAKTYSTRIGAFRLARP